MISVQMGRHTRTSSLCAREACPITCGLCDCIEDNDDATFVYHGRRNYDCAWLLVEEKVQYRRIRKVFVHGVVEIMLLIFVLQPVPCAWRLKKKIKRTSTCS